MHMHALYIWNWALTIPLAIWYPKLVKLLRCGSMSGARVTGQSEPRFLSSAVCTLLVWPSSYIDCMCKFWILGVTCLGVIYLCVCLRTCGLTSISL